MGNFTLISWYDRKWLLGEYCVPSLTMPYQKGEHNVRLVSAGPSMDFRNMGQAYNAMLPHATHPIKIFVHQDVKMLDDQFLNKLEEIFSNPRVGLVGILGSTVDTGGGYWHAPKNHLVGISGGLHSKFTPQSRKVKVLDCLLFATNMDIQFADYYAKSHMLVEDYCMRVRKRGKEIWTVASEVQHASTTRDILDDSYWQSAKKFRKLWRDMLPADLPSLSLYKRLWAQRGSPNLTGWLWDSAWKKDRRHPVGV